MTGFKVHLQRVALVMALVGWMVWQLPTHAESPPTGTVAWSEPLWTMGEVGDHAGPAGILITDVDQDGTTEIITCTANSPYLYRASTSTTYAPAWYGERVGCAALALAASNGTTPPDLFVGSRTPTVYRYRYETDTRQYVRSGTLSLTGTEGVSGVATGDVDGDGNTELVVTRATSTTVYDAATLTLEWDAVGMGGTGVKIGNVDADSRLEIIVNGGTGYILNAATQSVLLTKTGGWGRVLETGDTDNDGRVEFAYVNGATPATSTVILEKMEGGTFQTRWELSAAFAEWVTIGEVDGGAAGAEVIVGGNATSDAIAARNSANGDLLWTISNAGSGVQGMAVGDSNQDGVAEIWWGSGQTSSSGDQLMVGSSATRSLVWRNRDYEGPFFTAAEDIDADGTVELIAVSTTMNDGNYGGVYLAYDSVTFREELSRTTQVNPTAFIVAQVDEDAGLELVIGGRFHSANNGYVEVIDGSTRQTQWTRSGVGNGDIIDIKAANVDGDARAELFIAAPNRRVYVHDGASNTTEWEGGPYSSDIVDLEIADNDNDGVLELGVLTKESLYIYSTQTWALETTISVQADDYQGSQLVAGNHDEAGAGEWLLATVRPIPETTPGIVYESRLQFLDGVTYESQWDYLLPGVNVVEMLTQPAVKDEPARLYLGGYQQLNTDAEQPTYLEILEYDALSPSLRYSNESYWGNLYSMTLTDIDADGVREWFMGTLSLYQLRSTEPPIDPTAVAVASLKVQSAPNHSLLPALAIIGAIVGVGVAVKRLKVSKPRKANKPRL